MAKDSHKKVITKKHLARIEREQLQTRYILIASLVVILVTVGLVGYGILDQKVLLPYKAVAKVNGQKISLGEFQTRVRYIRMTTNQSALQTYQVMQMFGNDTQFQSYYLNSLQQMEQQLEPSILGQNVVDALIDETLIRQEAKRRNITASQEEIDALFQKYYGYYANGTPTPTPTFEAQPTSTLNATQRVLITPTSTPTVTPTPTTTLTSTLTVTPTLLVTGTLAVTPNPTLAITATATIVDTPTPTQIITPTATATPYTLEEFQQNYKQEITYLQSEIQFTEDDYRNLAELQILSEKVQEAIIDDLQQDQDQVWVRHIQVKDDVALQFALDQLTKGQDFGALAVQLSEDTGSKSNYGDLGWLTRYDLEDKFGDDFVKTAFETLQIGQVSEAVKDSAGNFHIIQLLGHEVRKLSPEELTSLRQRVFQDWLTKQRDQSDIETTDLWVDNVPTSPEFPAEIQQLIDSASSQIQ